MASEGYWPDQFKNGAPEVVANEIMPQASAIEEFLESKGPQWLGNLASGERKDDWAKPVVIHMRLVQDAVDKLFKLEGMVDRVILDGLQAMHTIPGEKFDFSVGQYLDDDMKSEFPRAWSYRLQVALNERVGKVIIQTKWFKDNHREIVQARRKVALIGGIMDS